MTRLMKFEIGLLAGFILGSAVVSARSETRALMLDDKESAALRAVLDAAVRANGISIISRNAIVLFDKLDAAGVVTESRLPPAPAPKTEGDQ